MDCQTFETSLLSALYDELDAPTATAFAAHASSCASCARRLAELRGARERFLPLLEVSVPTGLEDRILAAADAAMDAAKAPASVVELAPAAARRAAKKSGVIGFLARPELAVAATFVLVLGAAAL